MSSATPWVSAAVVRVLENPRTITPAAPLTVYAGQGQVLDEPMILPKARPREAPVVRDRHTDAASQALASVVALLDLKKLSFQNSTTQWRTAYTGARSAGAVSQILEDGPRPSWTIKPRCLRSPT
jgi:hypothetical protein